MKQAPGGEKTMLHASRTLVKQRAHFFSGVHSEAEPIKIRLVFI